MIASTPQLSSSSAARREFLQTTTLATLGSLLCAATTAPPVSAASFGGIEIRGLDVSEVMHPGAGAGGGKATKPLRDCLINVERVRLSTKQLEDELTNVGTPAGLGGMVKGLIKNYRLDDSLRQGALYIEAQRDRNIAASAGREALEYLAQTAEYFPPEIDDRTGLAKSSLSAEAMEFTVNALSATREKLDVFLSKVPPDALRDARADLRAENGES